LTPRWILNIKFIFFLFFTFIKNVQSVGVTGTNKGVLTVNKRRRNKPWYGGIKYAAGGRGYVTKISFIERTFSIENKFSF
jgi:hypothetical protein